MSAAVVLWLAGTGFALAQAQVLPPPSRPSAAPRPAAPQATQSPEYLAAKRAFDALPEAERRALELDLIWAVAYSAPPSGTFTPALFAAIRAYETQSRHASVDGILSPAERKGLAEAMAVMRTKMKYALKDDPETGIRFGHVGDVLVKHSRTPNGSTRWQDAFERATLDLTPYKPGDDLKVMFERATSLTVPGRRITEKVLRDTGFVVRGETETGKFYRRVDKGPKGELRGFSLGYAKDGSGLYDRILALLIATYQPFPTTPLPKETAPVSGPVQTPLVVTPGFLATGLVVAPGRIVTLSAPLKACRAIGALVPGGRDIPLTIQKQDEARGLLILSGQAGRAVAMTGGQGDSGVLLQREKPGDGGGIAASATSIDGQNFAGALQAGGAGAPIFDRKGALVGIAAAEPASKRMVAGVALVARHKLIAATEVFSAAGVSQIPLPADAKDATLGALSARLGSAVVALRCAD